MDIDQDTKSFMKELVEFISLIRASEQERYELQKKFMEDTIGAIKEISETIKANDEYIRSNLEKMKEILTKGINNIRKEIGIDSIVQAKNVLGETVDILQKETQLTDFKQTLYEIRSTLEKLQQKDFYQKIKSQQDSKKIINSSPEEIIHSISNQTEKNIIEEIEKSDIITESQIPPEEVSDIKISKIEKEQSKQRKKGKEKKESESDLKKVHIDF